MDNKRYWLRWGMIFAIIHLVIFILLFIPYYRGWQRYNPSIPNSDINLSLLPLAVIDYPVVVLDELSPKLGLGPEISIAIVKMFSSRSSGQIASAIFVPGILGTIQWLIIGMISGSIYGKIKNS